MFFFFERHGMDSGELFRVNRLRSESFPAHMHRACELIYVAGGSLLLQVEQKQYHMTGGELAFVFGNQIHGFTASVEADAVIVLFSPELIGDFCLACKNRVPACNVIRLEEPPDFFALKSVYAQKSMLYSVCDRLLAATELAPAESNPRIAALQQIFAYVDSHYGGDCSLKAVAGAMQYDYAYLSKLFAKFTGVRFTEYLNGYRIARACYLLKNGGQPVAEVASVCGYATLRTFHRNFRALAGCSPRDYIAQNEDDPSKP